MPVSTSTYTIIGITPVENPQDARLAAGRFKASVTIARGTILAVLASTGELDAYTGSGTLGLQTAVGVCQYDIITSATNQVFLGNSSTALTINVPNQTGSYWSSGTFKLTELVGYTGNETDVLGDLQARINGNGHLYIP